MIKHILLFLAISVSAFAGTVRLYNDSPFKLRAVIRGADGSYLGEMVVLPEHTSTWSSDWQYYAPNRTTTPYTVYWSCLDGGNFGIDTNIASGGLSAAESSNGPRYCKPPPPPKKPESEADGPSVEDEHLHFKNEAPRAKAPTSEDQQ